MLLEPCVERGVQAARRVQRVTERLGPDHMDFEPDGSVVLALVRDVDARRVAGVQRHGALHRGVELEIDANDLTDLRPYGVDVRVRSPKSPRTHSVSCGQIDSLRARRDVGVHELYFLAGRAHHQWMIDNGAI